MSQLQHLFELIGRFAEKVGIAEATLSTRVFNDGGKIESLRQGRDIGVRRLERAIQWFSDHWPADTDWPLDIERPAPTEKVA